MRRADRLFQLLQHLRHDRAVTARDLAEKLEVSERTIYRDIQDLSLSGIPITGEAGVGYVLMKGFKLSPLMFTEDELAALLIGARMVQSWTDLHLARAAERAMDKINHVIPEHLQRELDGQEVIVPDFSYIFGYRFDNELSLFRSVIRNRQVVQFSYTREDGEQTQREVNPLGLFYWGKVWTLVAWCMLRKDFRQFRIDRMEDIQALDQHYKSEPGQRLKDFIRLYGPSDV